MNALDLEAARLLLIALRASLPTEQNISVGRVVLAPEGEGLSPDSAARALASKPKPLECHAYVADGTLVVSCGSLSTEWRALHRYQVEDLSSRDGPIGSLRTSTSDGESDEVLILGRGEALLARAGALEAWTRDYVVTLPLGITSRVPDQSERALGARAVIEFDRVDTVDPDSEPARRLMDLRRSGQRSTD